MKHQLDIELHNPLEKREKFEELLLELSAHFIRLPAESIDGAIEDAQRLICQTLNLDLSALWQWSEKNPDALTITHLYSPPDGPEAPADIDATKTFPWFLQNAMSGKIIAVSTEQLPVEANIDKESRRFFGVKSSVVVPIRIGDRPIMGIMSWDTLHEERTWNRKDVQRLRLVTEIFSNALARKQAEEKINIERSRVTLATEAAEAGIWEFDYNRQTYWASDRALQIFGFSPGETVSQEQVLQVVHPEDRKKFVQTMAKSFSTGEKTDLEFRSVPGSGAADWILGRGLPIFSSDGSPHMMTGLCVDISRRKQMETGLRKSLEEIKQLKQQLEQENYYLREELCLEIGCDNVIGQSKAIMDVLTSVRQVALTPATVLLLGETGTGKGIMAHALHEMSDRSDKAFVTVNCAALPGNLIESELFGREKGAFTGANARQVGRFELANHGTIFLDEIGEMPLDIQSKLLRVLQEGEFERLGSPHTLKVDVRVIAATCRNLREDVQGGRFREDLFYRLNVFPITIPPLRERKEDIPLFAQHFVEKYCQKIGKKIDKIPRDTLDKMMNRSWPGNVRELEHEIERAVIISAGNTLACTDHNFCTDTSGSADGALRDLLSVERDHIESVLIHTNWRIEGPGGAAAILDLNPSTLRFRMKKLGIKRPA